MRWEFIIEPTLLHRNPESVRPMSCLLCVDGRSAGRVPTYRNDRASIISRRSAGFFYFHSIGDLPALAGLLFFHSVASDRWTGRPSGKELTE